MGVFLDNSIKNVVDELNVRYFCLTFSVNMSGSKTPIKKIEQLFDSILRAILLALFYFGNYKKRI
ncbi:hypothetical protein oki169_27020 [Helicobacter pylori]